MKKKVLSMILSVVFIFTAVIGTTGTQSFAVTDRPGQEIASYSFGFMNTPYVWGGTTPSGFDCSGFTSYVYGQYGFNIGRTTYDQINAGREVTSLQPGDLVFFGSKSSPGHVGIYIGDGKYIHAPRTGDVVRIAVLSDRNDYCAARRIVNSAPKAEWVSVINDNDVKNWYFYDSITSSASAGWKLANGKWYYLNPDVKSKEYASMKTGWVTLSGKSYYLYDDGHMAANERTPDGYYVDANGVWDGKPKQ